MRATVQRVGVSNNLAGILKCGQAPTYQFIQAKLLRSPNFHDPVYRRSYRNPSYGTRDIDIPFTVTGPLGNTFQRTVSVDADSYALDVVSVFEATRVCNSLNTSPCTFPLLNASSYGISG